MKQLEFLWRQMNCRPRYLHQAPGRVEFDVSDPDGGGLVRLGRIGAAHDSAKPRRQLPDVKGLSYIVVRAGVKRLNLIFFGVSHSQHHNPDQRHQLTKYSTSVD